MNDIKISHLVGLLEGKDGKVHEVLTEKDIKEWLAAKIKTLRNSYCRIACPQYDCECNTATASFLVTQFELTEEDLR